VRKFLKILAVLIVVIVIGAYVLYKQATTPPSRVDNPIVTGVHYVGMTVSDLDLSTKFYSDSVDLKPVNLETISNDPVINKIAGRDNVQLQSQLMKSVNSQIRFMHFDNPSEEATNADFVDANGPGIAHVCYQVDGETHAYEKFLAGGGSTIGDPEMIQLNAKNPVKYAYARDLDKTMVEIEHVDIAALNLPTPPKNKYRIRHVSLATTDMNRAVAFYSTLLETENPRRAGRLMKLKGEKVDKVAGFEKTEIEMAWFQVRNLELEIVQYFNPAQKALTTPRPLDATGYNMIVFNVTDLASAKEKLLAAGGTIEVEDQSIDGAQVLFGRDLDGNLLGFQILDKQSPFSAKNFKDNGRG
jgi:catechol 2,3-dioxygenase-like lactoylglutathione lyase family enzyme